MTQRARFVEKFKAAKVIFKQLVMINHFDRLVLVFCSLDYHVIYILDLSVFCILFIAVYLYS